MLVSVGAVVEFNGDEILAGLYEFCDVEEISGVTAFMLSSFNAVDPDAREIERGAEMQFDMLLGAKSGDVDISKVPSQAFMIFVLADVPGVRNADNFCAGGDGLKPLLRLAFRFGIDSESPLPRLVWSSPWLRTAGRRSRAGPRGKERAEARERKP